ncbi:hypothetical protein [Winogradskyella pulchriflava]|uniref:Uncharacterized protein n=1 Tax=Winogradskyella pulchriflava TaxID=1110688 RepID=A0ABV6Q7Q6_9FLAO
MKTNHPLITFCFIFLMSFCYVNSQNFSEKVEAISSNFETVEASKAQFSQDIKVISSGYVVLTLTEVDSKGETETVNYEFSFSDVDVNTVRAITKKDVILVQLLINGKQKLIKKSEDGGDKVSYIDELYLYAKDIDNGRNIADAIKDIIPLNETIEKNKLSLTSYSDHLQWLMDNVVEVDYSKKQYVQKITNDSKLNGYAKLETIINEKSKSSNEDFEFNFAVLNPNSIDFKIRNDEFYIEVATRRNIKNIKTYENDVQNNFVNKIEFYANSIENGKDIYKVLKAIIPLAEEAFSNSKPNIGTKSQAISYLNGIMGQVTSEEKAFTQSVKDDCVTDVEVNIVTSKGNEDNTYTFNFIDINSDNIDYDSQKDILYVELHTNQKSKFIKHVENGELQNYDDEFKIYVNSIEEAMIAKEAFQNIIKECLDSVKTVEGLSETQGLQKLSEIVGIVKINEDTYEQTIELIDEEAKTIRLTQIFSNDKKSEEVIYEFGLKDINSKSVVMTTSGKNVLVEMSTKYFEKIIKTYKDGEIKSYGNKIVIEASSIENAREIVAIMADITKD